jgi:hypothetical protein
LTWRWASTIDAPGATLTSARDGRMAPKPATASDHATMTPSSTCVLA